MRHHHIPYIGDWYQDQELNARFEVVAIDDEEGCVEVQFSSGEIESYDLENWYQMLLILIPAQNDAPSSNDDVIHPEDWSDPLDKILF